MLNFFIETQRHRDTEKINTSSLKKLLKFLCVSVSLCFNFSFLYANEPAKPLQELMVEEFGQVSIEDKVIEYRTVAGTLVIKDDFGNDKASVFYIAYFLKGNPNTKDRPLTFCFNGGPGAGSVWLNLGFLGPKSLPGDDIKFMNPPYTLVDNPDTFLPYTDLIFVDPISSGFTMVPSHQDPKNFHNVDDDVQLMVDFVRQFTSKNKRWDSPKYLLGESYGGMRVVKMGMKLHDEYGYYLNGLFLISPALDFQTFIMEKGNDLPFILYVPSYAAAAKYHKKINQEDLRKAEEFALKRYSVALLEGNRINLEEKKKIAKEYAELSGLSEELVLQENLRIKPDKFRIKLLLSKSKVLGRFDDRILGSDLNVFESFAGYDPSLEAISGAMTASYTQFLLKDLKWPELKDYRPLVSLPTWNWGKANQYVSAVEDLKNLMLQNPDIKVFIASGYYDLAIPYFGVEYSLSHMNIPQKELKRLTSRNYEGGHMMYLNRSVRKALKEDMAPFFNRP